MFAVVNPAGYRFVSKLYREVEITTSGGGTPGDVSAAEHLQRAVRRAPGSYPYASGVHERQR